MLIFIGNFSVMCLYECEVPKRWELVFTTTPPIYVFHQMRMLLKITNTLKSM